MTMTNLLVLLVCVPLLLSSCAAGIGRMSDREKSERLATERGRLPDLRNPVDATRSQIMISRILLDFIGDAVRDGDDEALAALLPQYTAAIKGARNSMVDSDIDATRRPAGFKDLEIALREQARLLTDLSRTVALEERDPLIAAIETASTIQSEMLELLFPQDRI